MAMITDAAHARSAEGFAEVYAAHRDRTYRLALLLCGDPETAEDAVADAFAKVWPKWEKGRVDDVGPYLRRATVNNLNSFWRRLGLRREKETWRRSGDHRGRRGHDDEIAEQDAVAKAVRRLPDRQRACVVLRFWEDLPTEQIADTLGIGESTVRSNLHRASETLQDLLGPDAGGAR